MSGYSAERARILSGLERHIPSKSAPRPRSTLKKLNGSMRIPSVLLGVWSAIEFMQPFDLVLWALTIFSGLLIGIMYFGLLVIVASIGDSQDGADSFFPRLLGLFGVNFELPVL